MDMRSQYVGLANLPVGALESEDIAKVLSMRYRHLSNEFGDWDNSPLVELFPKENASA